VTSHCKYGSEVIEQGEASQIIVDGRYHETLSLAVIVNRHVPEQQGEGKNNSPPDARLLTIEIHSNDTKQSS
jgi:hypothetical protein